MMVYFDLISSIKSSRPSKSVNVQNNKGLKSYENLGKWLFRYSPQRTF